MEPAPGNNNIHSRTSHTMMMMMMMMTELVYSVGYDHYMYFDFIRFK